MEIALDSLFVIIGFAAMIAGADFLVKGGSGIARSLGMNPLVVGLTIVAYGTSMPEFMASMIAMWQGVTGIALGNVFGSNIFNIAMVMGIAAVLQPIEVDREVIRVQVPITIGVTLLVILCIITGTGISRVEGVFLFAGIVAYTLLSLYRSRGNAIPSDLDEDDVWAKKRFRASLAVVFGCFCLFLGGRWVVNGATGIAEYWSIPDRIIGSTIVALGTSLPELVTTVVGIHRKEIAIGIGNAIGSCIFNLLMVVGGVAALKAIPAQIMDFKIELIFVLLSAVVLMVMVSRKRLLRRRHGIALIALYVVFIILVFV